MDGCHNYLLFNELDVPKERKTGVWEVRTKSDDFFLGTIQWRNGWRRYVHSPTSESHDLDVNCMKEICTFIDELMIQREKVRTT